MLLVVCLAKASSHRWGRWLPGEFDEPIDPGAAISCTHGPVCMCTLHVRITYVYTM